MGLECKIKESVEHAEYLISVADNTSDKLNLTFFVFWGNVLRCMPILHRLMETRELQLVHKSTTAGISVLVCSITHIVLHCQHSLVMAFQHCGCFEAVFLAGKVQRGVAVLGTQCGYTFTYGGTQLKNTHVMPFMNQVARIRSEITAEGVQ